MDKYFNVTMSIDGARYVVKGQANELRASYPNHNEADLDARRLNAAYELGKKKAPGKTRRMFPTIGAKL